MIDTNNLELTILMPCLNEAETLAVCIKKAQSFLTKYNISGEILIADNGSTDGSQQIAKNNGARIVDIPERGYGAALIGGCNAAYGKYVIMGDADDSYDFSSLMPFIEHLRLGDDLVMGNRFKGGILKGAMPPLHKYFGNPVLSSLGRLFFKSPIGDFHCGLRGYNTERMISLGLHTTGMEYASEMIVQATINKYKISEVPVILSPDGRSRAPHLRSWHDGWRHLKFLLIHSPNWLFLYPGLLFSVIGLIFSVLLEISSISLNGIGFDINTLLYSAVFFILGVDLILFHIFTKIYAIHAKFIKTEKNYLSKINAEKCVLFGLLFMIIGIIITIMAFLYWKKMSFGSLNSQLIFRITIPAAILILLGVKIIFAGFLVDILRIKLK